MLAQLLDFINNLSIDEKLYWRVDGIGSAGGFEIYWQRANRPKPWSIRRTGAEAGEAFATQDLPKGLAATGVDCDDFERKLGVSVLTQAVFADMVMQAARQLFGAEVVARSINDTRAFLSSVSQMAQAHASPVGKTGRAAQEPTRPILRLVPDNDKLH